MTKYSVLYTLKEPETISLSKKDASILKRGEKMQRSGGMFRFVFIIAIALVIFAVVAISIPKAEPIISVSVAIDPDSFKTSQQAILTINLENKDLQNQHSVDLSFTTNEIVYLYLGQNQLQKQNIETGNYFSYNLILQPGQKTNQPFLVRVPTLPVGITDQHFSITTDSSADGQNSKQSQEVTFTVSK